MAPETSKFESTEMLATFLGSTPLLEESWRLCGHANAAAQQSFTVNVVAQVAYVAFSGVQAVAFSDENCRNLVELGVYDKGIFGPFSSCRVEGKEAVMVHGGLLQLFLSFYDNHNFQHKISEILNECKSVVFTGHSLGGAVASLSALWLLSYTQQTSTSTPVLCITFGSPLLGNESFSQAIPQQRWAGNFCHIVAQHDLVPRMLFAPSSPFVPHLRALFTFWQLAMTSPYFEHLAFELSEEDKNVLFEKVLSCLEARLLGSVEGLNDQEDHEKGRAYWPFGSYMFCTEKGAICLDNVVAIVKFLYLIMKEGSTNSCIRNHLMYEDYVAKARLQYLHKGRFEEDISFSESSSEVGIKLALHASGMPSQEPIYGTAMDCLATARKLGWRRNLNNAKMAISLSKINPFRAEIEWYKARCDNSIDELGYYDSFKRRGASKRDFKVNMNRLRLARFWDDMIEKLEKNHLTHDFHKLLKYVNASQSYKLLVEPLEIAEYYRKGVHLEKGHYIEHGRAKRFKIFDKWWGERKVGDEESQPRRMFASLTQDSCFWAKVEEARDLILRVTGEMDKGRWLVLVEEIEKFEEYACGMVERKEVSVDVLAKNSSYSLFREEWRELKSQLQLVPPDHFPSFQDGMVQ